MAFGTPKVLKKIIAYYQGPKKSGGHLSIWFVGLSFMALGSFACSSEPDTRDWQCTNTETRDFRIETTGKTWTSSKLRSESRGVYVGRVREPEKGWTAFMVELTYAEPIRHSRSTRRGGRLGQATGRVGAPFKFTTGVNVLPETMPFEFKRMPIPKR